ncbi:hypothetical protein DFH28DRAFT_884493 [Melampsora americana]|nr:hypothetical protein DFH28DRAFT_884493 [Melampsora americana]
MQPNKPRKTSHSQPGPYNALNPPADCSSPMILSPVPYNVPANIHNCLVCPLIYVAPPPAGFDNKPLSDCFVCNVTWQPPHFKSHPVRLTLPWEDGIENDVLFAMKGSPRWIFQGKLYNGKENKSTKALSFNSDLSHHTLGPTCCHKWTKTWLCNPYGNTSPCIKPTVTDHTHLSGGSVCCQCRTKFLLCKTFTGDLEFQWYWRHNTHNPYLIEDVCNMQLPDVVSKWLNKRVISGLTWC